MARYRLHCVGASGNSFKVALFLNCASLDWEAVGVDFAGGETREPGWRAATNAMGEVPVLEFDGRPALQVWQEFCSEAPEHIDHSGAIGVGLPTSDPDVYLVRCAFGVDKERQAVIFQAAMPVGCRVMFSRTAGLRSEVTAVYTGMVDGPTAATSPTRMATPPAEVFTTRFASSAALCACAPMRPRIS